LWEALRRARASALVDRKHEGELVVALADVGLVVDAVEYPLADVALQMQQQIDDGVFVVAGAVLELSLGELVTATGDFGLLALEVGNGEGQEVGGYGIGFHTKSLRPGRCLS